MTYAYYHNVIKGKTAKNAPTYIAQETEAGKYICSVCGYEYSGNIPFEQLPDDWRCPVCGQPKSVFRKKMIYQTARRAFRKGARFFFGKKSFFACKTDKRTV